MRFGGIVLAALLSLGACSSDPEPKEPSPSATTPTPTATPPTMPAQAEEDSPEGAAAFVKHYIDVLNYAATTGDVVELTRLSSPTCEGCKAYIRLYRDTYATGGYLKGGRWKLGDLNVESRAQSTFLTSRVHVSPAESLATRDSRVRTEPGETVVVSFEVVAERESWTLSQLGLGEVK